MVRYNDHIIMAESFYKTKEMLKERGFNVLTVENSECAKIDGGMSLFVITFLNICGTRRVTIRGADSNHRHEDFQSTALPTELPGLIYHPDGSNRLANRWQCNRLLGDAPPCTARSL